MKHNELLYHLLQCSLSAIGQACVSSEATKLVHTHTFSHVEYRTYMHTIHLRLPSCEHVFPKKTKQEKTICSHNDLPSVCVRSSINFIWIEIT